MSKRVNRINILLAVSVIGLVLLSGCVDNVEKSTVTPTPTPTVEKTSTIPKTSTTSDIPTTTIRYNASSSVSTNTSSNVSTKSANSTSLTTSDSEWCTPGKKKVVAGKELTIIGAFTDNSGTTLCRAELETSNGKTVYVFSKDGNVSSMYSTASSSNGSASSYASSSASSNASVNTSANTS